MRVTPQSLINGKPISQVRRKLPGILLGSAIQRDGFNVILNNRVRNKLVARSKHLSRTMKMPSKEVHVYDNLPVGEYEDSYYNLALKLFYRFQGTARFCQPHKLIVIFIDDDYAVNTNNPYLVWAFSKREIPWSFRTPQHLGIHSVWSYRHVHRLALAIHFTKPMVTDDTWLRMVQHKPNLTPNNFLTLLSEFEERKCALLYFF
ncbi:unnamed protein product [Taenia asiatica]|uniref:Hexosyltransferase n=1 Tax=Taenia asiatica TaxID=60517 RepID=A0A0R3VZ55_TAEAS|nr:unnamed protein product [Taenia asiatica]